MADPPPPPVTVATQVKYDQATPNLFMSIYAFIHFALVLLEALLILDEFEAAGFSWLKVYQTLYITLGVLSISMLFDTNKSVQHYRMAMGLEGVRLGLFAIRSSQSTQSGL